MADSRMASPERMAHDQADDVPAGDAEGYRGVNGVRGGSRTVPPPTRAASHRGCRAGGGGGLRLFDRAGHAGRRRRRRSIAATAASSPRTGPSSSTPCAPRRTSSTPATRTRCCALRTRPDSHAWSHARLERDEAGLARRHVADRAGGLPRPARRRDGRPLRGRLQSWDVVNEPFWPGTGCPAAGATGVDADLRDGLRGARLQRAAARIPGCRLVLNEAHCEQWTETGAAIGPACSV